ncbi:hypothetical protein CR513_56139, partial [Mucuna pruriens]
MKVMLDEDDQSVVNEQVGGVNITQGERLHKVKQLLLDSDYEIFLDSIVINEGNIVHFALLVDEAMKEDVTTIERSQP